MKEQWQKLAARFDALGKRERVLGLAAALLGVVLVFYLLALDPLAARKKRLTLQLGEARQALGTVQQQLKAQQALADPGAVRRSYRDALRAQIADIDKTIGAVQRGLVPSSVPGADGKATQAAPKEPDRAIYQHGFEITLQGSYNEVHEYLTRVEKLPWQMFWRRISVSTDDHPKLTVTLTVQTLSLSKAWLIV